MRGPVPAIPTLPVSNISAVGSRMTLGLPTSPGRSPEEEKHHVRIFIRKLLEAYLDSSEYAVSRFNVPSDADRPQVWNSFFHASRSDLSSSVVLERSLKQLHSLHRDCIDGPADAFARLLLPDDRLRSATRRARIAAALSEDADPTGSCPSGHISINIPETFGVLQVAAAKFRAQVSSARKGPFEEGITESWSPDWRCQTLVWGLIKRLGDILPPPLLQAPYQELKETAFASLFEQDFIDKQWHRCSFKRSVLRYIPRPYNWDADLSWIGVSFFIAMPLTGFVQTLYNEFAVTNKLTWGVFWALFFSIFFSTSVGMVLFYAAYRSWYSTRLMKRAAVGTSYEDKYKDSPQGHLLKRLSSVPLNLAGKIAQPGNTSSDCTEDSDTLDAAELDSIVLDDSSRVPSPEIKGSRKFVEQTVEGTMSRSGNPSASAPTLTSNILPVSEIEAVTTDQRKYSFDNFPSSERFQSNPNQARPRMSPDRAMGFGSEKAVIGLQLYQASMFVQRIYGSTYFDESWAFGLSESQLREAVKLMLQTDSSLGRQYAAFSFAAIAVASRGVPTGVRAANAAAKMAEFNFGIFSFLGALSFVCGLTSAVLADLILRQMSFTQISREGTSHGFVERFGFFIRVVGGLNSSAGMFLSTAVLHFLMNIFKVTPYAVILLGAAWLILGTMVIESFFSNYHFWRMSEILDDVTLISEPDVLSPSPFIGALQFIMAQLRKMTFSKKKKARTRNGKQGDGLAP